MNACTFARVPNLLRPISRNFSAGGNLGEGKSDNDGEPPSLLFRVFRVFRGQKISYPESMLPRLAFEYLRVLRGSN
jgi:hypothetical protein